MWDPEARYPDITAEYCRTVCAGKRCPECPGPMLLPECQPGYAAYLSCGTQWRYSHAGRTGLDYQAVIALLERRLPHWQRVGGAVFEDATIDTLLDDIQIVESATLRADSQRRERERAHRER